ncbi:MAG: hypothetical protein KUF74_03175, partial [Candidatus Thiodiazotropha sp. (ex Ctena orbiculata)]|nr:hypothetical protein [Candidatus Thiodiazotropha taylori]
GFLIYPKLWDSSGPSPLFYNQYGGLRLKKRHSALLVAHLEQPNFAPRALIGAFSGATGRIGFVLTGPSSIRF